MYAAIRINALIILLLLGQTVWGSEPLFSVYKVDVDGNGRPDKFTYSLQPGSPNKASLEIQSDSGAVLWEQSWLIEPSDLATMMDEEGRNTIKEWVRLFFQNSNFTAGSYVQGKLKADDLSDEYIDYWANELKVPPSALKRNILSQKVNKLFYYRAEWREDFYALVYVPQLRHFVQYTGYGDE